MLKWIREEWDEGREYPTISDEERILWTMFEGLEEIMTIRSEATLIANMARKMEEEGTMST